MIFKPGHYRFKDEMDILVNDEGVSFISAEKVPLSVRTSELFNVKNWKEVIGNGSTHER